MSNLVMPAEPHDGRERSELSLTFEDYWRRLRGDRDAPVRPNVSPRSIPAAMLPGMFIVSIGIADTVGTSEIRLAGTRFRQIMNTEVTGIKLAQLVADTEREKFQPLRNAILERLCGVWLTGELPLQEVKQIYTAAYTFFPLKSHAEGPVDYVIGLMECDVPLTLRGSSSLLFSKILQFRLIETHVL